MSELAVRDLGRLGYLEAFEIQRELVEERKRGHIPNQLLFVEHPHTITLGRNAKVHNILASPEALASAGIAVHESDRGGDVTYHGPGQIVGYPILDLREWKRDVVAYLRALEETLIRAVRSFGVQSERAEAMTGIWVNGAKLAAMGVHISRWVTSHGFALNHTTDLRYFQYIVPCGLTKPVTSLQVLGVDVPASEIKAAIARELSHQFSLVLTAERALTTEGKS